MASSFQKSRPQKRKKRRNSSSFPHHSLPFSSFDPTQLTLPYRRFPETEKISPPLLQLQDVTFGYDPAKPILNKIHIDVGLDSRIAIVGANGAGKSTLCVFFSLLLRKE